MKRNYKEFIIVVVISLVLLAGTIIGTYFLESNEQELKIMAYIFFGLWSFSIAPSLVYFSKAVYPNYQNKSFEKGMHFGRFIAVMPLIGAPYYMYHYYISFFQNKEEE